MATCGMRWCRSSRRWPRRNPRSERSDVDRRTPAAPIIQHNNEDPMRRQMMLAALALCALTQPVKAQGVIPIALQQVINANGQPVAGALLYVYQPGTVATPQNAF